MVDEAYIDFGGESALPLIERYENVIVVQTFSKSRSLAGSRIGYAIAGEKLIKYLNDVKYSFNSYTMDRITIEIGAAAIADPGYYKETVDRIIKTREWTKQKLRKLGFVFADSKSNFVFVTHPDCKAKELYEYLKERDIFVRYFENPQRISDYLRITIGTDAQMRALTDQLEAYLQRA